MILLPNFLDLIRRIKIIRICLDYLEEKQTSTNIFWRFLFIFKKKVWALLVYIDYIISRVFKKRDYVHIEKTDTHYRVSLCITAMNRLFHIKKTLIKNIEHNLAYPNIEFVLLDYNSSDGLQKWVMQNCKKYIEKGILKYYRNEESKYFKMSRAKNLAHHYATGDIVCNLDADNFTNKNFAYFLNYIFSKNMNIVACNVWDPAKTGFGDFGGRICISKANFTALKGYDEEFKGWGYEDLDFRERAVKAGLQLVKIPHYFLKCIFHPDTLRDKNMDTKKIDSENINRQLYMSRHAKPQQNEKDL